MCQPMLTKLYLCLVAKTRTVVDGSYPRVDKIGTPVSHKVIQSNLDEILGIT